MQDMSITIIQQSAAADGLRDLGPTPTPLSDPPCRLSGMQVQLAGAGENRSGLWECQPGRFARNSPDAEVMHILKGIGTFTPTGREAIAIRAGDTLFFPAKTTGVWHIEETLRKVYVVMPTQPIPQSA
jgi:uncharacterized cupin superfamily protein